MAALSKTDFLRRYRTFHVRHEAVTDPLFGDDDFFDPRDLLLVKCEMLRRVRLESQPIAPVVRRFALCRDTFYEAWERWRQRGLLGLVPEAPGPRRPHKLTTSLLTFLRDRATDDESRRGAALAACLWREQAIRVHPRTIERALAARKKGGQPSLRKSAKPTIGMLVTNRYVRVGSTAERAAKRRSWCGKDCSPGFAQVLSTLPSSCLLRRRRRAA